jgi:hypothetical protein
MQIGLLHSAQLSGTGTGVEALLPVAKYPSEGDKHRQEASTPTRENRARRGPRCRCHTSKY